MRSHVKTEQRSALRWGTNIVAFALVVLFNWLANALPIGGQTTGEISDKYASLFTPAGFTFSIWGLIYLCLAGFVIYQALPQQRNSVHLARIDRPFQVNCLANITWICVWHYDLLILSVAVMACILATLVAIYRSFSEAPRLLRAPFSLYTAWITVASIANVSILQTAVGWENVGFDVLTWTYLKLAIAGTIGAIMVLRKADLVYGLVIAWAAFGIASKHGALTPEIGGAATLLALLTLFTAAFQFLSPRPI